MWKVNSHYRQNFGGTPVGQSLRGTPRERGGSGERDSLNDDYCHRRRYETRVTVHVYHNIVIICVCVYFAACNRTYHGEVGRTYDLEVRRPREDRLPFLCYLNFTAAGGKYGDIIQVNILYSCSLRILSICQYITGTTILTLYFDK